MADITTYTTAFQNDDASYDDLLKLIGSARFVLIGEASHGTHEFYEIRAELTKRLIEHMGFMAVAAEADWPDAYQVNRFVQGTGGGTSVEEALSCFKRFPSWMWRNTVVVEFVRWLRAHNLRTSERMQRAGFYGLDLYSLHSSMHEVIRYLDRVDPEGAQRARHRYSCIEDISEDPQSYGYAATFGLSRPCIEDVVSQLLELRRRSEELIARDAKHSEDELFYTEQNARLTVNAEEYYRAMFHPKASSWNLRDTHMAETLQELAKHLEEQRKVPAKIVVWAHNSHLGDARATQMGESGELNIGQLARERWPGKTFTLGFTTSTGTVTAAHNWDELPHQMNVRPAIEGSYEKLFHDTLSRQDATLLPLRHTHIPDEVLPEQALERAIGVIYRPETERISHYFQTRLRDQFDAVIHIDETRALEPLEKPAHWTPSPDSDLPDTYPSGL